MIRKPGSDKGPGFSMFGAYVCGLIEGYVKLRFTHADIEVYEVTNAKKSIPTQGYALCLIVSQQFFSFLAMLLSLPSGGLHILLHSVC